MFDDGAQAFGAADEEDVVVAVAATQDLLVEHGVFLVDVGTQVSGTIKEIYVDYNSRVTKGQLVAMLDTDMLQSRVDEVKASLALAQARVTSAKASAADADRTFRRNKELWSRNLIARSELIEIGRASCRERV